MTDREDGADVLGEQDAAPVSEPMQGAGPSHPDGSGMTRRLALVGARSAIGLIGVATAVVAVAAATWLPIPVLGTGPASTVVTPVAATQLRICPGPVLQLGDDTGQEATTANSLGRATVVRSSTQGTPALEDMDATGNESNVPSQRLSLPPGEAGDDPGLLAGSQSQYVETGDDVGFAATDCATPSAESWLVGGSTVTGRTTLIALNNPSKVSSTVSITVYSETGPVSAAGTDGIVVPPGGQRILSLAGFAPGIASPVVRVVSTGGQVTANLQQSIVRTLAPGGVDLLGASTRPSTLTVIPGVIITDHDAIAAAAGIEGYQDIGAVLRMFVPDAAAGGDAGSGSSPVPVTVTAIPEDGASPAVSTTLDIDPGVVADLPFDDFASGEYTITVSSEVGVVAAARTSIVSIAGDAAAGTARVRSTDFAWFVGAPELRDRALVSIAPGPSPLLHLANTGTKDAVVTIEATAGASDTVTVPAGGAVSMPATAGRSYLLAEFDSLRVAVTYRGDGRLAGFVVRPQERVSQPVTVYRQYG
ncbi:hypothetical protein GCM10022239_09650 [Leifsonia bigeumensis]|uniref:Large extracellular alpha-helical protein n=1 Tax=Leifsonella bigeumensis TaxID=433643 RepID=A0ABP7FBH5_9MICO